MKIKNEIDKHNSQKKKWLGDVEREKRSYEVRIAAIPVVAKQEAYRLIGLQLHIPNNSKQRKVGDVAFIFIEYPM